MIPLHSSDLISSEPKCDTPEHKSEYHLNSLRYSNVWLFIQFGCVAFLDTSPGKFIYPMVELHVIVFILMICMVSPVSRLAAVVYVATNHAWRGAV